MLVGGTLVKLHLKESLQGVTTMPTVVTFVKITTIGDVKFIEAFVKQSSNKIIRFWQRLDSVGIIEEV